MNVFQKNSNFMIALLCFFFSILITINAWYGFPISIVSDGQTYYSAFQGVFPWSDAHGYFDGPKIFANTGHLDAWNTRRPLTSLYYSSLNLISFNSFYVSLLIRNILFALALATSLNLIYKKFSFLPLSITTLFIFDFSARYLPTTLSETPGLTLGCLSFSICWFAIEKRKSALFLFGIFMFCIALNARSGAFFILPLLIIYFIINFSKNGTKIEKLKLTLLATLSIFSAFFTSYLLTKYYGAQSGSGIMQGNFAPTLYGLVTAGKGWTFAYTNFPNFQGNEAEFSSFLYKESFHYFLNHPKDIFIGFIYSFIQGLKYFLIFTSDLPLYINLIFSSIFILFMFYIFIQLRKSNKKIVDFLAVGVASYFLSSCIIAQDGGMRVFSVTIIFNFVSISVAISYLLKKISIDKFPLTKKDIYFPITITSILLFLSIFLPGIRQKYTIPFKHQYTNRLKCKENETNEIIENITKQPYIYVDKNDHSQKKIFSFLTRNPYTYNLLIQNSGVEKKDFFQQILNEKDQLFILGYFSNQLGNSSIYIVDKSIISEKSNYIEICYTSKIIEKMTLGKITNYQTIFNE